MRCDLGENSAFELARDIVYALEEKKAEDIVLVDLRGIAIFTDFFIICSGTSDRMLRSLIKAANEVSIQNHDKKGRVLGSPQNGWIAVDYGDIVLHIFSPNQRDYYQLEDLWAEGKIVLKIK